MVFPYLRENVPGYYEDIYAGARRLVLEKKMEITINNYNTKSKHVCRKSQVLL